MNPPCVTIKASQSKLGKNQVYMSHGLCQKLSCDTHITITFGRMHKEVSIIPFKSSDYCIMCCKTLLQEWGLFEDEIVLRFSSPSKDELLIGPVICVVTEIKSSLDLFGSITTFCEEFASLSDSENCFFYVSTLDDLLQGTKKGYTFQRNSWILQDVPLPNVIHNRIHNRKTENAVKFQELTIQAMDNEIPFFNAHYLNKWKVFERLSQTVHLNTYLPDTYQLRSKQDLLDALSSYQTIFLKPIHGSQGKHIFKIAQVDAQYQLDYTTVGHEFKKEYDSPHDIFETLFHTLKKQGFIIQEGINLQTYKGCPFDFRILCHKQSHAKWKVTSIVTRVSQKGFFVSNVARGGEIYSPKHILTSLYDEHTAKHIIALLKEIALEICVNLPFQDETYAEFGIDLAIDANGQPWIIEVNTKPSKQSDEASQTIRPSTKALMNYCLFITRFH
ncbi:YheC/YheD family protein [Priestia flexa]|uniref:YheC/YheD family endospore coat-associated protein n=1 Tax=Priestia flexa TaxID=86664 RepID=UPI001B324486|nr:YheC/YheD family protein [Priestia flexa]